jgi:hypothetical protein
MPERKYNTLSQIFYALKKGDGTSAITDSQSYYGQKEEKVRKAVVVWPPANKGVKPTETSIPGPDGKLKTFLTYRIYFLGGLESSDMNMTYFPIPGTPEFEQYIKESEISAELALTYSTKVGLLDSKNTEASKDAFGMVVDAREDQSGVHGERFIITQTEQKYQISSNYLPTAPKIPDFSGLGMNSLFYDKSGKNRPVRASTMIDGAQDELNGGSVRLASRRVNFDCLDPNLQQKIFQLAQNTNRELVVTSAFRTDQDVERLNQQGAGTSANSTHNFGWGVDFSVKNLNDDDINAIKEAAFELNLSMPVPIDHGTGKHFHFELRSGDRGPLQQGCSQSELDSFYEDESQGES